jgi:hypothetical protein
MGKLRSLGESIKSFTEPVVKAAQKVRDVAAGLWDAWTGESGEALLKKMMSQNASFALATSTSQFLAANVQSIQLKEALKQQHGQLHQIMQSIGQAYQKGGQAAVNSLLSTLRQTDVSLHSAYNQVAGYAKLYAEDVAEEIQDQWGKVEEGLEKAASFVETGASYVVSFLQGLVVDTAVSTYEGIRDMVVDTYQTTKEMVLHPVQTFKNDFSRMESFWDKLTPEPRHDPKDYNPVTGPFQWMWDEIKDTRFTIEPYKDMFKTMFRPVEEHIEEFKEANPNQKVRVVGHGIGELLLIFAPMKGGSWLKGSNLTAKEMTVEGKLAAQAEEIVEEVAGGKAAGNLVNKPSIAEVSEGMGKDIRRYADPPPEEIKFNSDVAAEKKAEEIRNTGLKNIESFAKNIGLELHEAIELKSHLFLNKYDLPAYDEKGLYFYKTRLTPDPEVVYAFHKAVEGELTSDQKKWFLQLKAHELDEKARMDSEKEYYRHPESWDFESRSWKSIPPGAHDNAVAQPEFGTFPGYKEESAKFYKIKKGDEYDIVF